MNHKEKKIAIHLLIIIELLIIALLIGFIGASLNVFVMSQNEGRMPVYHTKTILDTPTHFTYYGIEQVNYWYLSDIIVFDLMDYKHYTSIGDWLVIFSIAGMLHMIIISIHFGFKRIRIIN